MNRDEEYMRDLDNGPNPIPVPVLIGLCLLALWLFS